MANVPAPTENPSPAPVEPADTPVYRMAFVLYHWPYPTIERTTLRALLPKGEQVRMSRERIARYRAKGDNRVGSTNQVSRLFLGRLNAWDRVSAISREAGRVRILDRQFFAPMADLLLIDRAMWLAEIVQDYRQVSIDPELRRRELLTLQRLMEGRDIHHGSGRGSVRAVPAGRAL